MNLVNRMGTRIVRRRVVEKQVYVTYWRSVQDPILVMSGEKKERKCTMRTRPQMGGNSELKQDQ